ncbi:hypothetical protein CGCVW01_v012336 [Colletotrichum viniferum]|nr:hypothetical protein CGCVW01_v012336 [Colletotrichum viniferum]
MKTFGDNHAYRSRIAREAIATLDGYRHEAMNRHEGRVPSLEEGVDGAAARMQLEVYALDDAAEKATRRFKGTPHEKDIEVLQKHVQNHVRTPRYCLADITPDAEGGWVFVVDAMA